VKKKLLLIRLDKIGDLICTLPVDQFFDANEYEILWAVQKGLGQVVELGSKKRNYFELDKNDPEKARAELRRQLKAFKPDAAVSFQCPWWVNFELFKSRVPLRAGVKSQWHSFLFLNKALRQKRSQATKHEYDYNLELIQNTFQLEVPETFNYFEITPENPERLLARFQLTKNNFTVVHPGMMGSALNWPQSEYIRCIEHLIARGETVAVTGTASDENCLDQIKLKFAAHPQVRWLQSQLTLKELASLLAASRCVIAPSTGVAHLAASAGALTKGLYSPVQVQHPKRWAPRGPRVEIFMLPEVTAECF
jgi:ADP-heptose:LPS heptosyltransferase